MIRKMLAALLVSLVSVCSASAQNCGAYPNNLTNGTNADASQVMANFNTILNCANTGLAGTAGATFTGSTFFTGSSVGIGTTNPQGKLHLQASTQIVTGWGDSSGTAGNKFGRLVYDGGLFTPGGGWTFQKGTDAGGFVANLVTIVQNTGNVGIGTNAPGAQLHTTGSVRFAAVANCGSGIASNANGDLFCLASSRQFKNIAGELAPKVALANVMALRPQTGAYKETPDVPEHWLIAEEVANVDPALIGLNEGRPHVVKTQNVVADLIVVVQQQQQRIDALERRLAARQ